MKIAVCDDSPQDAESVIRIIEKYARDNNKDWMTAYYESGEAFIKEVQMNLRQQ